MLSCGPAPGFDKSCWFDNKFSLGLDFPNLPYYVDGDVKVDNSENFKYHYLSSNHLHLHINSLTLDEQVTQSNAILRFIARKYDNKMLGTNMTEMAR